MRSNFILLFRLLLKTISLRNDRLYKYFGFLKYFSLGDNSVNLIDEREESEILIYARKIFD